MMKGMKAKKLDRGRLNRRFERYNIEKWIERDPEKFVVRDCEQKGKGLFVRQGSEQWFGAFHQRLLERETKLRSKVVYRHQRTKAYKNCSNKRHCPWTGVVERLSRNLHALEDSKQRQRLGILHTDYSSIWGYNLQSISG